MRLKKILIDSILILCFVIFPHSGLAPMYIFPFIILGLIWLYLRQSGENFESIGFTFNSITLNSFLIGAITGISYAFIVLLGIGPLINFLGFPPMNIEDFNYIRGNYTNYIILMLMAWIIVIPFEEILFRGFIFTRIRNWFFTSANAFYISSLITSLLFAAYHYQEGTGAVLQIFIFGLVQMGIYKMVKAICGT